MKQQQNNKISLKKLTIARINIDAMHEIKGGSSLPTFETFPDKCNIEP
ncbi:class I lanthipeptide [uncultured Aquimarina sp.]|nr:class I lanthipeptide [uncultured Aquimarina sp.]